MFFCLFSNSGYVVYVRVLYFMPNAGGGFRTHDLQIMSIAFYGETGTLDQAELPRHKYAWIFSAIKWFWI